jgi:hypothetical protein
MVSTDVRSKFGPTPPRPGLVESSYTGHAYITTMVRRILHTLVLSKKVLELLYTKFNVMSIDSMSYYSTRVDIVVLVAG